MSGAKRNSFGGWAATLIDSLDTLWIMGMRLHFRRAVEAVSAIDFGKTEEKTINVFETNIRHLGGLLAAYELSGEETLLRKAMEVGEMLLRAFDTPNGMPITRWDFHKAGKGAKQQADEGVLIAEIGSLSMEFSRLSQITGDSRWYDAVNRITEVLDRQQDKTQLPGMWPLVVDARNMDFTKGSTFTIAAMADSLYEYFAKTYALLGGLNPVYKKLYEASMETVIQHTLFRPLTPSNADVLISGVLTLDDPSPLKPELQHLVCFSGGMLALGGKIFSQPSHVTIGAKMTEACIWAYHAFPHRIMPEKSQLSPCQNISSCSWDEAKWKKDVATMIDLTDDQDPSPNIFALRLPEGFTSIDDRRYILRPEAIESIFVLYRITGEHRYQEVAWDMFTAIQAATETEMANAALADITVIDPEPPKLDSMESFWMAETLKYFYLIFSEPDVISLDDYVFNTEAHPFRIPK